MAALWRAVSSKWNLPFDEKTSFAGKTVLITGTTIGGLGFEAAQKIAALNATKLIITARSEKKGQAAKEHIERYVQSNGGSGKPASPQIELYVLDMDDFSSVKAFAEKVNANVPKLDAVILNAGLTNRAWFLVTCPTILRPSWYWECLRPRPSSRHAWWFFVSFA